MGVQIAPPASQTPPAGDQANSVITGTFAATGQSPVFSAYGWVNLSVWGTFSAGVQLERTFDGGTTWIERAFDATGAGMAFTGATSFAFNEVEKGVSYRLNCTGYVSGTVNYRMSGTALGSSAFGPRG